MRLTTHTSSPRRSQAKTSDDRRALIDLEAAQRRDPFAVGPADGLSRSLRERWSGVVAGLRAARH